MPEPLRSGLTAAGGRPLFTDLTGRNRAHWERDSDTAPASRLTLAALGSVVTAYEHATTDGEGRNTWRTDRYSPCPHSDAGGYLAFLAGLGYPLSAIEQAVMDGRPYTDETPAEEALSDGEPVSDEPDRAMDSAA